MGKAVSRVVKRSATSIARSRLRRSGRPVSSPEQSAEEIAAEQEVAALANEALTWLARGRPANIEVGRRFIKIKARLGHGHWEYYFAKKFAIHGITLRTAENYMRLAREEDSNIEKLSFLATDADAVTKRAIYEQAEAAFAAAALRHQPEREPVRLDGVYKLPLFFTAVERDAMDQLRKSEHWSEAERRFVDLSQQLFAEFGIINASQTMVN
jgi:hypothetical protein